MSTGTNLANTIKTQSSTSLGTPGTINTESGNVFEYYASGNQTIDETISYQSLTLSGGSSSIKTLNGDETVPGVLTIAASTSLSFGTTARTLTLSGTSTNHLVNNGTIDMSGSNAAHLLKIAATSIATYGALTTGTGSTVEFYVNGAQTIGSTWTYNHLTTSTGNTKTLGAAITVNGNLTIGLGTTLSHGTNFGITLKGNWTNNGTFTPGSNTVTFSGTGLQTITGVTSFYGFTLNNSAGLSLADDVTISNALTLTSGTLTVDANTLTYSSTATPTRTSGNVNASNASAVMAFTNTSAITLPASFFTGNVTDLTLNGAGGVTLGQNLEITSDLTLTSGTLTVGANNLTLSGNSPTRTSGNIDASNASATLTFTNTSAITLPASFIKSATTIKNLTMNGSGGVTLGQETTVTGTLTLTSGVLVSTSPNIIYIGNGGTTTGSSSSSYVNGILKYYLTNAGSHFFPIGDALNFLPFEMNSVSCTSGAIVQVNTSSTGASTADGSITSVSARNWFMDYVSGTLNNATIRITENGLTSSNVIGKSSAQSGNYVSVGGTSIGSTISSSSAVTISSADAYFAIGVVCTPPTTQATSLNVVGRSGKDISFNWTRGNGGGVVVFVKATSDFTSDPTDGVTYTANATYSSGTAMGGGYTVYSGTGTSVTVTGLSGGTTYYIRVYEKSASGCFNSTELSGTATTYCLPATTPFYTSGIQRVRFNTIDNTTTATHSVNSYITTSTTLVRGSSYNLTANAKAYSSTSSEYVRVWIDWNNDGSFNTTAGSSSGLGEQYDLGSTTNYTTGAELTPLSIKVPTGASSGYITMRVSGGYYEYFTSCATGTASNADAEFEDYTIIIGACPTYSGTYTVGTGGTWVTLTDALAELKTCSMTGSVILELDETYRTTQEANETYPLDFSGLPTTSSITLTIRPRSNVTATITMGGSSTNTLFDLNNANYITVDGRLGGSGANRLIIENTSSVTG
jgi:hypothetical protein